MIAMLHFATLLITTMFAGVAAVAFQWLLLRAAFLMMSPATARRVPARAVLARSAGELSRAFST